MKIKQDPRHTARKLAMSSIFSWLFLDSDHAACMALSKELLNVKEENADTELTNSIVAGVTKDLDEIDGIIKNCAPEWPLEKISKIDLVILRIAVFELVYGTSIPNKVVIDEAVELAKEFGNDTSSKFVNGVLGSVLQYAQKATQKDKQEEELLA